MSTSRVDDVTIAPPFVTFEDRLTVWVDDPRVELHYIGTPAHTTNDVVAWIPERSVLFTGDLVFAGGTPFVSTGSVAPPSTSRLPSATWSSSTAAGRCAASLDPDRD